MFGLGIWELLIILVIVLLFAGSDKLPGLGRGLGKAITQFKDSLSGSSEKDKNGQDADKR
jgi:sec-independent protein translocase protein TatA